MFSASELAHAIRTGQVSAVEIVETELDRIAQFNPRLNAVVTVDAQGARLRAREADRALAAGKVWGPLHGVPITIKDSFDTAGLRTVSGYRPFASRVPAEDATPVARLARPGRSFSARPTFQPWPTAFRRTIPSSGVPTTRGTFAGRRAAAPEEPRRRFRPASRFSNSAATSAGRSGFPLTSAASAA